MSKRLSGKTALITGAGSGIGRAAALRFAAEGARVVVADFVEVGGRETVAQVIAAGGEADFVRVDVVKAADVEAMIGFAEQRFGALHVLFNNAGIFPDEDGSVLETDEATFDRVINVNLKGVFFGCKYGIPALLRAGGGSLINTASFVAVMGSATAQSAYTASKGGVLALTREIAVEFARKGLRANALCPGPVNTPLLQTLLANPEARARRLVHLPMGRLAEAEEVANAALFLASDESSYVNGSAFLVDGGTSGAYVTAL
ncbi:MAG: glucose 1-dehydrogenase [Deltaproteobacteria bacterium]|nr:glucose 1-dehydrogenase [Deltaproteobacteria bacterium]